MARNSRRRTAATMTTARGKKAIERRRGAPHAALEIAQAILDGFDNHYRAFRYVSQQAKAHYENGDWPWMQKAVQERIAYYDRHVARTVEHLRDLRATQLKDVDWQQIKQHYTALIVTHKQPECAETFFNSVSCKILHRDYFNNDFIFVRPSVATEHVDCDPPSYRSYYPLRDGLRQSLRRLLIDFGLASPFVDVERDIRR